MTMDEKDIRLLRRLSYENRPAARDLAEERSEARRFLANPETPSCFGWFSMSDFTESDSSAVRRPVDGDRA